MGRLLAWDEKGMGTVALDWELANGKPALAFVQVSQLEDFRPEFIESEDFVQVR